MYKRFKQLVQARTGSHFAELATSGATALALKLVGMALGYVLVILISHYYGAETLGIYALSITLAGIFAMFARAGMDPALVRFVARFVALGERASASVLLRRVLALTVVTSSISASLYYFLSPLLSTHLFNRAGLLPYFQIAAVCVVPLSLVYILAAYFRGLRQVASFSFLNNVGINLFAVIAIAWLGWSQYSGIASVYSYLVATLATVMLGAYLSRASSSYQGTGGSEEVSVRKLLRVALPLLLVGSMNMVTQWADILMLGVFRTEREVGIYTAVMKLAMLTTLSLQSINAISAPRFSGFFANGELTKIQQYAFQSTRMIFWTSLPILALLCLAPGFFLGLFGPEFHDGRLALVLIAVGGFFSASCGSVQILLQMTEHQVALQYIMITTAVLNVLLNLLLIPMYGIEGAALATMLSHIFSNLASVIYCKKVVGVSTFYLPGASFLFATSEKRGGS